MIPLQDTVQGRTAPIVTWVLILLKPIAFFHEL